MEKTNSLSVPVVTLSNGLRVANFSSPHDFQFVDDSILPACSPERAKSLMLESRELEIKSYVEDANGGSMKRLIPVTSIKLNWEMSDAVRDELLRLAESPDFDILLVPLPVMTAMKEAGIHQGKCRCIRMADRVTKKSHIDRFCV